MLSSEKHQHHPSEYERAAKKETFGLSSVLFLLLFQKKKKKGSFFFFVLVPLETIRDRTRIVDLCSVIREGLGLGDGARVVDLGSLDCAAVVDLACHFCLVGLWFGRVLVGLQE